MKTASESKAKIDQERRAEIGREKRARTRAAILASAFDVLGHPAGMATPIDEICVASGVSRATFYKYFRGLDELLISLSHELSHDFNRAVTAALQTLPTAAERISAATQFYLRRAVEDPKWGWAMIHLSACGRIFGDSTFAYAQADVEFGIERGEFELPGPNSGRDLVLGAGFAAMITQLRHSPSETFPRSIARHILLGLGVPERRATRIADQPLPPLPSLPPPDAEDFSLSE